MIKCFKKKLEKLFQRKKKIFNLSKDDFLKLSYESDFKGHQIRNTLSYHHEVENGSKRIQSAYLGQSDSYHFFVIVENHLDSFERYFRSKMYKWEEIKSIKLRLEHPVLELKNLENNFPRELVFFLKNGERISLTFDKCGIVKYKILI